MINRFAFGKLSAGPETGYVAYAYTLISADGKMHATVCEYGARILNIRVKVDGADREVVAGYDTLASYENAEGYLGAVVGRIGNRIARGKFTLDGVDYTLYCNDGENHLHGGKHGFDQKLWRSKWEDGEEPWVEFSTVSPDGDEGYPGTLTVTVRYTLTKAHGLRLDYHAATDKKTILNLTNHAYFNLQGGGYIGDHVAKLSADRYIPTDAGLIPTGEIRSVEGTAFDFRVGKKIDDALNAPDADIVLGGGVDHCLVFGGCGEGFVEKISVTSPDGKLTMRVLTSRPCVQFYTGNFLGDARFPLRGGVQQTKRCAFCLETQAMPDAINHPNFTRTTLAPGAEWTAATEYRFDL